MEYFYDHQFRRLILQVIRMFGGFKVAIGKNPDGTTQFRQVPVRWGQPDRMVANIIRLNSENKILPTPLMAVHITNISMAPERRQNPTLVRTNLVDERKFEKGDCGHYTSEIG